MKSFAVAAFAGAASAAWAPPAYGGESSSSSAPAYTAPAYGASSSSAVTTSSASMPAYPTAPVYGASTSSSMTTYACNPAHSYPNGAQCVSSYGSLTLVTPTTSAGAYGTGSSAPAYQPKPTGNYGWGNGTEGGHGGYGATTDAYVTQIVTSLETYCPYATTLTYNSKTYTVTEATTLTVTDCPCEVTKPAQSYQPSYTTEVVTAYTTYCPESTEITHGASTYTATASETVTLTGYTSSYEVPATWVVSSYSTVCPSPSAPTTVTIGTQTYPVSEETTIYVTAPTSYATLTSYYSAPTAPVTTVIESSTYEITSATSIVYSSPTGGLTVTAPYSEVYPTAPAASTPVAPVPMPSASVPAGNGTSPVSPYVPEQTGNGAARVVGGSAAVAAIFGAFFL